MRVDDDERMVTVTVAKLKAFKAAVRERARLLVAKERLAYALKAAEDAYRAAALAETNAVDAEIAATKALHAVEEPDVREMPR